MSRHRPEGAKHFHIQFLGYDWYRISWTVDRYYSGSRQRFPRVTSRDTDQKGAERFAKRHEIPMPEAPTPKESTS